MVDSSDITLFYTVGGYDVHYDNMLRSIQSIKDRGLKCKFMVLEFGNKLKSTEDMQVLDYSDAIDFNSGKVGYLIWKHKYIGALQITTKYGMYVDSDTVMAYNNIPEILEKLEDGIAVTQHFWVPNISQYQSKACPQDFLNEFLKVKSMLNLTDDVPFFAGGAFIFKNTEENKIVFERVLEWYNQYYTEGKGYVRSITDELFLAAALNEYKGKILQLGGGFNHCSMGDNYMPMVLKDGKLYGRNPYEDFWSPITILHCDISRRDPSQEYSGEMKKIIRERFHLDD